MESEGSSRTPRAGQRGQRQGGRRGAGRVQKTQQHMPLIRDSALASAVANATPEQRRTMLGEKLYPLVDQLEHERAPKVTGMLLELDQTEVLHLLESPDALKAKVSEAMDVLRYVQQQLRLNQLNAHQLTS